MKKRICWLIFSFCSIFVSVSAQDNLLKNPNADLDVEHWKAEQNATVEDVSGGNRIFVVRNKGSFRQTVELPEKSVGQYALLIGRGASERINADGAITGLPYLYGYLLSSDRPDGKQINTYLTGQKLLGRAQTENEWVVMFGVFQVPKETVAARIFLSQAERRGVPQNGSAARFDEVGLYLFETEKAALNFVERYE